MPKPNLPCCAGLALLALAGCGPLVRPADIRVTGVSFSSRDTAEVELAVSNPNGFSLDILSAEYQIAVGGNLCGIGRHDEPIHVGARDSLETNVALAVDYANLAGSLPLLLQDTVVVKFDGNYRVKTALGVRRVAFAAERRIAVKGQIRSFLDRLFDGE